AEAGFVEGRNVAVEYRWADGQSERMGWMAAELISRRVTVMLVGGNTSATKSLLAANQTIPIVFTSGVDPVAAGLVASLNRPAGRRCGYRRCGRSLGRPTQATRRTGAAPQIADNVRSSGCRSWLPDRVRLQRPGDVSASGHLCRPHHQRREARQSAGAAADQV